MAVEHNSGQIRTDPPALRGLPGAQSRPDVAPLRCSVGIMAYNEEANIVNAIRTILRQQSPSAEIAELIVVASGCTDRTADLVRALIDEDARVDLILEAERAGKASAINRFIEAARSPVLVMVSADVLLADGAIESLVRHFYDERVGMVGGRPVPVNDEGTFLGHVAHLLWRLHDQIARQSPKLGEFVAFRNVVPNVPTDTAVDEVSLEARIAARGFRLAYEPDAVVFNRGPATVGDYMRQRRRIAAGHRRVARQDGYAAATMSTARIGRTLLRSEVLTALRQLTWTAGAVVLEATARGLGYYDYVRRRPHHVWTAVATTKHDVAEGIIDLRTRSTKRSSTPALPPRDDGPAIDLRAPTTLPMVGRASAGAVIWAANAAGTLADRTVFAAPAAPVSPAIPTSDS